MVEIIFVVFTALGLFGLLLGAILLVRMLQPKEEMPGGGVM